MCSAIFVQGELRNPLNGYSCSELTIWIRPHLGLSSALGRPSRRLLDLPSSSIPHRSRPRPAWPSFFASSPRVQGHSESSSASVSAPASASALRPPFSPGSASSSPPCHRPDCHCLALGRRHPRSWPRTLLLLALTRRASLFSARRLPGSNAPLEALEWWE